MVKLLCLFVITAFGLLSVEANKESRIIGGKIALNAGFPYHVQIRNVETDRPFCGGSIVGERFVLTSAYCIKQHADELEKLRIIVGEVDIRKNATQHVVDKLIPHPLDQAGTSNRNYDIGLVRVAKPFQYTENVQPIRLPTKDTPVDSDENVLMTGFITGWGPLIGGQQFTPVVLHWMRIDAISRAECLRLLDSSPDVEKIAPSTICLKSPPTHGPCEADAGGALTTKTIPEERVIIAVLARTVSPCPNILPNFATRVFPHLEFIRQAMQM